MPIKKFYSVAATVVIIWLIRSVANNNTLILLCKVILFIAVDIYDIYMFDINDSIMMWKVLVKDLLAIAGVKRKCF